MKKICKKCGILKDVSCFTKSKNVKDGYENSCKECRREARKKHVIKCEICGKEFKTSEKEQKFCSAVCQGVARRKRYKTNCSYCNKEIERRNGLKKWEYAYCNQDCRAKHLKQLMKGENNPFFNSVKYKCDGCGKEILVKPWQLRELKHIFCSNECYKNNIGKFYSGENNSNWNHFLTEEERKNKRIYPEYYKWRSDVYERDSYTCQCCGNNKSGNLIAHHLNSYNSDKEHRTDVNNGITVCKKCHKEFHDKYGYGNNTVEQFKEFLKYKYDNTEVK